MLELKPDRLEFLSIKELFEVRDMLRRFKKLEIEIDSTLEAEVETYLADALGGKHVIAQYY